MPGMLSVVSGQFTKYIIFGTLLPVIIFVALAITFVQPIAPASFPLVHALEVLNKQWFSLFVIGITVVLSGLIYNLNIPIVRLYEGYPWRRSRVGRWCIRRGQERLDRAILLNNRVKAARPILKANHANANLLAQLQLRRTWLSVLIGSGLPSRNQILPTRFGNTVKSFEEYPAHQYGMDAVTLWPRIIAVTPKDYLGALDDARTSMSFFLNCSFLSALTLAVLLLAGLEFRRPFCDGLTFSSWALEIVGLALASWLFYIGSVGRAAAWGEIVKSTFDLYRWDLLKQLGHSQKPRTRDAERKIWTAISRQIIYRGIQGSLPPSYEDPPRDDTVQVETAPKDLRVETAYGGKNTIFGRSIDFTCQITNVDSARADDVTLRLKPKSGWDYVWGSALVRRDGAAAIPKVGSNQQFELGSLESQQEMLFTCNLMRTNFVDGG